MSKKRRFIWIPLSLLQVKYLSAVVNLRSLWSGSIVIESLTINDASVWAQKDKNGRPTGPWE